MQSVWQRRKEQNVSISGTSVSSSGVLLISGGAGSMDICFGWFGAKTLVLEWHEQAPQAVPSLFSDLSGPSCQQDLIQNLNCLLVWTTLGHQVKSVSPVTQSSAPCSLSPQKIALKRLWRL